MRIRFRFIFCLILSFCAHLSLFWALGKISALLPPSKPKPKIVTVNIQDIPTKKPVQEKSTETGIRGTKGQLVDLPADPKTETQEEVDSKYLSDRFRKVDKETKARMTGPRKEERMLGGAPPKKAIDTQTSKPGKVETDQPSLISRSPEAKPSQEKTSARDGIASLKDLPTGKDLFRALDQQLNQGVFAASDNHFLPDVDSGDSTQLNTTILSIGGEHGALNRDTQYYSYFQRIRRALELIWRPETAIRQAMRLGERFGQNRAITTLQVTLNSDGSLSDIKVDAASGIHALDQEAVRSMKESAPFHNPPPGLIERSQVRIAEIFLPYPQNSSAIERVEIQAQASLIVTKLKSGESFEDLAKTHSKNPSAKRGGELGFVDFASLQSAFQRALSTVRSGEITPPIDTSQGIYILKLLEENEGKIRFRFSFIVEG